MSGLHEDRLVMLIAAPIWMVGLFYLMLSLSDRTWWLIPLGSFLVVVGIVVNILVFRAWRNSPRLPEEDDEPVHDERSPED